MSPSPLICVKGYLLVLPCGCAEPRVCVAKVPIRQSACMRGRDGSKESAWLLPPSVDLPNLRLLYLHCHCSAMSLPHRPNLGRTAVSPVYTPLTGSPLYPSEPLRARREYTYKVCHTVRTQQIPGRVEPFTR
jgi:hypothetical protein